MEETRQQILISAAMILNERGEMLVVRKRGTERFMQPGGKIDAGETPLEALGRELHEEIAVAVAPEDFVYQGIFEDEAANEPGATVVAHVFSMTGDIAALPQAEIAEARWLQLEGEIDVPLAKLTENRILPLARRLAKSEMKADL